jgi:hypothetical protein
LIGFEDEQVARKFFRSLHRVGWGLDPDDLFQVHEISEENPWVFYIEDVEYRTLDNLVLRTSDSSIHSGHYHWDEDEMLEYLGLNESDVQFFNTMKPKEVNKHVAKQKPRISEEELRKRYERR